MFYNQIYLIMENYKIIDLISSNPNNLIKGDILRRKAFEEITYWQYSHKDGKFPNEKLYTLNSGFSDNNYGFTHVDLYLINTDEIRVVIPNGIYYDEKRNQIVTKGNDSLRYCQLNYKLVIASTDKSLKMLPKLSDEIITKFCNLAGENRLVRHEEFKITVNDRLTKMPDITQKNFVNISTETRSLILKFLEDFVRDENESIEHDLYKHGNNIVADKMRNNLFVNYFQLGSLINYILIRKTETKTIDEVKLVVEDTTNDFEIPVISLPYNYQRTNFWSNFGGKYICSKIISLEDYSKPLISVLAYGDIDQQVEAAKLISKYGEFLRKEIKKEYVVEPDEYVNYSLFNTHLIELYSVNFNIYDLNKLNEFLSE